MLSIWRKVGICLINISQMVKLGNFVNDEIFFVFEVCARRLVTLL